MCGAVGASNPSDLMSPTIPTDGHPGILRFDWARLEPLAYRSFVRPIAMRKCLIDQNHGLRFVSVGIAEISSPRSAEFAATPKYAGEAEANSAMGVRSES